MTTKEIQTSMAAHDWRLVAQAQNSGPAFVPQVRPFMQSADELQRLLAVDCAVAAGGPDAGEMLLSALQDANEQVRINAVNGLHRVPMPAPRLLKAYDTSRDSFVRQQLALILGRDDSVAEAELRGRLIAADSDRPDTEVVDGLVAALAKHGASAERDRFSLMLRSGRGERIKTLIDYCRYIDQQWLVPALRPVLDRDEMAVDLSSHRTTLRLRGKDLAVDEIARLTGQQFSFTPDGKTNYSSSQVAEVIRFVESYRP